MNRLNSIFHAALIAQSSALDETEMSSVKGITIS